jgi:phenylpyruvate tautomerase PptA (4-oxalocrotonate tautomerase family)
MKEGAMPFVEVFTREKLSDKVRTKLAEELSNTVMTVEVGTPTESAKLIDWMWFRTMPADSWAVGGRFDDTYVKGRKMAHARIIAPQGLMNAELKSRAVKEVACPEGRIGCWPGGRRYWDLHNVYRNRRWTVGDRREDSHALSIAR